MKFCRDCRHYEGREIGPIGDWWERCMRPRPARFDLVSGEQKHPQELKPHAERYGGECGEHALHFESK